MSSKDYSLKIDENSHNPAQNNAQSRIRTPHRRDLQEYVAGCCAAVTDVCLVYPLSKAIFRQQLQGVSFTTACGELISEGPRRLYRGLLPPLIQKMSTRSIMFGTYDHYSKWMGVERSGQGFGPKHATAAFLAGSTEALLCPFERVQTLLQSPAYHNIFRNTWDTIVDLRPYGLREYYRGLGCILLRNGPSNIIFFGLREPVRELVPDKLGGHTFVADFLSGAILGGCLSCLFFPMNVLKTRSQFQLGGPFWSPYRIFRLIFEERDRSIRALFRGVHVNFTRSCVSWGIINAAYEIVDKYLMQFDF